MVQQPTIGHRAAACDLLSFMSSLCVVVDSGMHCLYRCSCSYQLRRSCPAHLALLLLPPLDVLQVLSKEMLSAVQVVEQEILSSTDPLASAIIKFFLKAGRNMGQGWVSGTASQQAWHRHHGPG